MRMTNFMNFHLGCDIYAWTSGLLGFVSIITLAFMSIERYIIVYDPLKSSSFGNKTKLRKKSLKFDVFFPK
jgi:hypothetical protein